MINIESLKEQLSASLNELEEAKAEFEEAKSHVYRCDGVIQLLKHLIQEAEKPETPSEVAEEKPASE